jgi:hypothetical protein
MDPGEGVGAYLPDSRRAAGHACALPTQEKGAIPGDDKGHPVNDALPLTGTYTPVCVMNLVLK